MSVYVDDMYAPVGRMKMCHMVADSREELDAMADRIGVARKWIQAAGTFQEHYDIAMSSRRKAVAAGAVEITWRELGRMTYSNRIRMKYPTAHRPSLAASRPSPDRALND